MDFTEQFGVSTCVGQPASGWNDAAVNISGRWVALCGVGLPPLPCWRSLSWKPLGPIESDPMHEKVDTVSAVFFMLASWKSIRWESWEFVRLKDSYHDDLIRTLNLQMFLHEAACVKISLMLMFQIFHPPFSESCWSSEARNGAAPHWSFSEGHEKDLPTSSV